MMASFGMLTVSIRSSPSIARSIASKSRIIGSISPFSAVPAPPPAAASKISPPPDDRYGRFTSPSTLLPASDNRGGSAVAERLVWKSALDYYRKEQKEGINNLQWMLDSLRIARMPSNTPTTVGVPAEPRQQQQQKGESNDLQWIKKPLRIALLPIDSSTAVGVPVLPQQQQRTFQVMNRNARKAKRANHGKRPCSRIRRRYKVKKWANTCRKG